MFFFQCFVIEHQFIRVCCCNVSASLWIFVFRLFFFVNFENDTFSVDSFCECAMNELNSCANFCQWSSTIQWIISGWFIQTEKENMRNQHHFGMVCGCFNFNISHSLAYKRLPVFWLVFGQSRSMYVRRTLECIRVCECMNTMYGYNCNKSCEIRWYIKPLLSTFTPYGCDVTSFIKWRYDYWNRPKKRRDFLQLDMSNLFRILFNVHNSECESLTNGRYLLFFNKFICTNWPIAELVLFF